MADDLDETKKLLDRARAGEQSAFDDLFSRHRGKLRRAIMLRMDRRVAARIDASDVVQETYLEAHKRLPKYLKQGNMPFSLWLHWLAREKLLELHRRHLGAQKRAVQFEVPLIPVNSSAELVSGILGQMTTPSQAFFRMELANQLRAALGMLDDDERDLILWRHFEQRSASEMALLLNITEAAASKRYVRAVERLRKLLIELGLDPASK
jgi:RNA polymerase sigma-70 factor, ECF subfamily